MKNIMKICLILFCLGLLPRTQVMAQDNLNKHLEFRDRWQTVSSNVEHRFADINQTEPVKPWREDEKKAVLKYFQLIQEKVPGFIQRASNYRPIRLYRATSSGQAEAIAQQRSNRIIFYDKIIARIMKSEKSYAPLKTLIHEITHLFDYGISSSKEWVELVKPRLSQVHARFKEERGYTVWKAYEDGKLSPEDKVILTKLYTEEGFPDLHSTLNLPEAFADYNAVLIMSERFQADNKGYAIPEKIKTFVQTNILSKNFIPRPQDRFIHEGLESHLNGNMDAAARSFTEAVKLDPNFFQAYEELGVIAVFKNDLDQAISDNSQALKAATETGYAGEGEIGWTSRILSVRSMLWIHKRAYDKTIADCNQILQLEPSYVSAYKTRAKAWEAKGQIVKSFNDYTKVISFEPNNAKAYFKRGTLWFLKSNYQEAILNFNTAIKLDPDEKTTYIHRAYCYGRQNKIDEAIADYTKAIKLDPKSPAITLGPLTVNAYLERGNLWWRKKDLDQAVLDYEKMIQAEPDSYLGYWHRGYLRSQNKEYETAIPDLDQVIKLYPSYVFAYTLRGDAYFEIKKFNKAIEDYSHLIKLNPKNSGAYLKRGKAQHQNKKFDKAIEDYNKALSINPKMKVQIDPLLQLASAKKVIK